MNFLQMLAIAPLLQSNPEPTMSKAQAKLMLEHLAEERVETALGVRRHAITRGLKEGKHPNVAWQDYLKSMEHLHLENYNFMGITKEKGIELWEFFKEEVCQVLKEYDEGAFKATIEALRDKDIEVSNFQKGSCPIPASVIADKLESGEMVIVFIPLMRTKNYKWVDESRPEAQDPEYLAYRERVMQDAFYYYEVNGLDLI